MLILIDLRRLRKTLAFLLFLCSIPLFAQKAVTVRVQADRDTGPFNPVWAFFGYDEPNYTYAENGRKLVGELAALSPVPVQIRAHNLLTSGDGIPALKWGSTNAYTEDASGHPVYDWTIIDRIFDTYIQADAKPFVEIGFMPEALSTHPEPYRHDWPKGELYTGWTYPPRDYAKWAELVRQWVLHSVERYGKSEVESWYWEVWNEPNIGYWHGTPEEYNKLYDYAADAVKRALPSARVGGPATTGPSWEPAAAFLRQFLEHCARGTNFATGSRGAPLDFISFHDKGSPKFVEGRVQMGLANGMRDVQQGFQIVSSFPEFAKLPVVLSESDPEGCAACSVRDHPQNAYRNGLMYPAYTAAAFGSILNLAAKYHIHLAGILTWAFEFEGQPYFDGTRSLATNGIDKPVLNLFRMLGVMAEQRVEAASDGVVSTDEVVKSGVRSAPDVNVVASRSSRRVTALVWNYHDDDISAADTPVRLRISGLPKNAQRMRVRHYRIDEHHSNAYSAWMRMGSPQDPSAAQRDELEQAGQLELTGSPEWRTAQKGALDLEFPLPRQAVSLIEMEW